MTKFSGKKTNGKAHETVSISLFNADKDDLIKELNKREGLMYTSLAHFCRKAINTQLKKHGIDFKISEL